MAWEASMREFLENPMDFTVADGTAITKGTILKMTDPRTAIIVSAAGDTIAGIAARDKVANDGRTRLAVYRRGIFDMYASGAITVGMPVAASATPNFVAQAGVTVSGAGVIGHALETASDGELIQVYVNVGIGGAHLS